VLDLRGGEGPTLAHLVQHPSDELGLLGHDPDHAAPGEVPCPRHPPAEQRLQIHPDQRRLVAPELEQLPRRAVGRPLQQRRRIRPQAAVERQEVGALQHVHRIHLDQVQPAQHAAQVAHVGRATGRRVGEALRGQRDAARLGDGERIWNGHRRAR
jgi:hypothetical protein